MLVIGDAMPFISLVQPLDKHLYFSDSLVTLSEEGRSRVQGQENSEVSPGLRPSRFTYFGISLHIPR